MECMLQNKKAVAVPIEVLLENDNVGNFLRHEVGKSVPIYTTYTDTDVDLTKGLSSAETKRITLVHWYKQRCVREALMKIAYRQFIKRKSILFIAPCEAVRAEVQAEGFSTVLYSDLEV